MYIVLHACVMRYVANLLIEQAGFNSITDVFCQVPFYEDLSDIRVVLSVMQGKIPVRPSHQLSRTRGLSDAIWQLVETC